MRVVGEKWHSRLAEIETTAQQMAPYIAPLILFHRQPETVDLHSISCLSKYIKWYPNANISLSYSSTVP